MRLLKSRRVVSAARRGAYLPTIRVIRKLNPSARMSRSPFDWLEFIGWVAVIAGLIAIVWVLSLVMG